MIDIGRMLALVLVASLLSAAVGQEVSPPEKELQARRGAQDRSDAEAELAVLRSGWNRLALQAGDTARFVEELKKNAAELSKTITGLLTSEAGRKIASKADSVNIFLDIFHQPIVTEAELKIWAERIAAVKERADARAKRSEPVRPTPQEFAELKEIRLATEPLLNSVNTRIAMLTQLTTDTKELPPAAVSLEEAARKQRIANLERELEAVRKGEKEAQPEALAIRRDAARSATIEAARRQAAQETAARLVQVEIERMEREQQLWENEIAEREKHVAAELAYKAKIDELEKKRADAEAIHAANEAKRAIIVEQGRENATKIALRQKCHANETRQLLEPFLAKGYYQPVPNVDPGSATRELGALSLKNLSSSGALAKTDQGLLAFMAIASTPCDSLRPRWNLRKYYHGYDIAGLATDQPKEYEKVIKAQDLLIELGPLLVEEGMLAP